MEARFKIGDKVKPEGLNDAYLYGHTNLVIAGVNRRRNGYIYCVEREGEEGGSFFDFIHEDNLKERI